MRSNSPFNNTRGNSCLQAWIFQGEGRTPSPFVYPRHLRWGTTRAYGGYVAHRAFPEKHLTAREEM